MEANQFVDSYAVKKTKSLELHKKMLALGIHFFKLHFHMSIHFCLIPAIPRHVKLLMDALHILCADIKDELMMYTGTNLIHKVVPDT
jgi:hypothetical protein